MAKFSELIKGFRSNVRNGIPSSLIFTGEKIHLTNDGARQDGFVGICDRPTQGTKPEGKKKNA